MDAGAPLRALVGAPAAVAPRVAVAFGALVALLHPGLSVPAAAQAPGLPEPPPVLEQGSDPGDVDVLGDVTGRYPLDPPDTSSPRATLRTFLTDARETWRIYFGEHESRRERYRAAGRRLRRATRCLDLSEVPAGTVGRVAPRTVILLLDVLERVTMPRWTEIPDLEEVESQGLRRWRIPHTDIELHRVESGPRAGEFLFTPATVERAHDFYLLVRHLEPREKAVIHDGYALYSSLPGWLIPLRWIRGLPDWMQAEAGGQRVWQWLALLLPLLPALAILLLVRRWTRGEASDDSLRRRLRRMVLPLAAIALALLLRDLWLGHIGPGSAITFSQLLLSGLVVIAAAWLSLQAGGAVADLLTRSPGIDSRSVDASVVHIIARLVSLVIAVFVLIEGARLVGIPVMGVLAGLGVGGLAVALAAQTTIENFIGSLSIFADRPVRVGDFCRFGDEMGTIEQIGLRSTRIRTLGRSLITIPNAEFSRTQVDNFSLRDANLVQARIALGYETTPDQLRSILESLRALLQEHPRVLPDPARVRLEDFGDHAFEIEVFAYVDETRWNEYLEIREQLLLRITDAIEAAGARLAVPARTNYLVAGGAPDAAD